MLFISPPFGNYVNLPYTIPIRGSFTLEPRKGLFTQILKTLRYSKEWNGWVNKIGLRNPGLDYAIKKYYTNASNRKNNIISIAILSKDEIPKIKAKIPDDMNIEINVSCPNTEKGVVDKGIHVFINEKREWCIIKLAPIIDFEKIDKYYEMGFRQFHCCNTYPIHKNGKFIGGLSGPSLRSINKTLIHYIRIRYPETTIIAGGGIQSIKDIENYKRVGANHFSVSTLLFSPLGFMGFYYKYVKSLNTSN